MNLSRQEMLDGLRAHGLALAARSATLAPADRRLYALRDITATVETTP